MNSIRNLFSQPLQLPGFLGNAMEFFQKFTRFSKNPIGEIASMQNVNIPQNFNGGPQELVNYLISTGQMSKEQLQQFETVASQIQSILPKH